MTAPQEPLVTHLKRAGEQVLGAKPLTGNDHVRLSALLKVAALELEALCAARDDAAELRAAAQRYLDAEEKWQASVRKRTTLAVDAAVAKNALRAALAATEERGEP